MKKIVQFIILISLIYSINAQTPVAVMETTFRLKANSTEEFYYSFAQGDNIIIDFEELNGKEIKQFEVIELPSSTKFSDYKTSAIHQKQVYVAEKNVYLFKLTGATVGNRECHVTIQRIPQNAETAKFNTAWKWATIYDTTYTNYTQDSIIGYDTISYVETKKEVVSQETHEERLVDVVAEVKSTGIIDKDNPREVIYFSLPNNKHNDLKTETVVGWAYWIGVGDNASSVWQNNEELMKRAASSIGGLFSPLAGLAAGLVTDLAIPSSNTDNVIYYITNNENDKNVFLHGGYFSYIRSGNGPGAYGKFLDKNLRGGFYICLYNDNMHQRIRVTVKVSAFVETTSYQMREYPRTKITPQKITLTKTKRNINSHQVRIPVN